MLSARNNISEKIHSVTCSGQRLSYSVTGQGPPLVFIHGYGTSGRVWSRVIPLLAQTHQLFMLDLPGYGRSPAPRSWQLRTIAPLICEWLSLLQLSSVSVIGHSMGGAIAIHLTSLAPSLVQKVILVNAANLPLQEPGSVLFWRGFSSLIQPGNGSYPLALVGDALRPRFRVLWQTAQEMLRHDFRVELASITNPTLIIWGKRDVFIPIEVGYALNEALPHASLVTLPDCGHRPMLAQPALFCSIVKDFLAEQEAL